MALQRADRPDSHPALARIWLLIAFGVIALAFTPPVRRLDLGLLDGEFRILRAVAPGDAGADVVIVGIDEATFAAFPEPIALWHRHLAAILRGLAGAGPRAIGIDVELPARSYDFVQAGLDRELLDAVKAARAAAPLVIARAIDDNGAIKPVHAPFLAMAGPDGSGIATWNTDEDGTIRRFDERLGTGGETVPTFAGTIARHAGGRVAAGLVDYRLGGRYRPVPAHEVARWSAENEVAALRERFAGRIVLVASVLPFVDRHAQPVNLLEGDEADRPAPGVIAHAQAIRSMTGPGLVATSGAAGVAAGALLGSLAWFMFGRIGRGLMLVTAWGAGGTLVALALLHAGVHVPAGAFLTAVVTSAAGRAAFDAWHHRRERERLRRAFHGAVSPNVLALILDGQLDSHLGTGRRTLCVMFADIRNFTPMTERSEPELVVDLLNRYFGRMTAAIHAHDGTVDNFRGDGIMCFFGAPQPTANPSRDGFGAVRAMFAALEDLNRELVALGRDPIAIGASLATGEAVVGRIGAAERHEYTAIGDVANVSARIEALTKTYGYPLIVTAPVAAALEGEVRFDDLGTPGIKGHAPVHIYGWPARKETP